MPIRFAAPPETLSPCLDSDRARSLVGLPANDNGSATDAILAAALRHFAEHGLAAAQRARRQAETAFFSGDRESYQWWLEVCRTLDRRLAATMDRAREDVASNDPGAKG